MKATLLGSVAVALALTATNSVYADDDDFAVSIQDAIDTITDLRNDYLAESFFGESYLTPRMAAVETVNSAIDLYESTRANPHVQVAERGTFVQHPTNPYGPTVVAFEVINSMNANEEVYPFVIDAGTLKMLAEGAFPGTVGLSAVFLNDADRPLEEILADLQESDGTWATYIFNNPGTGRYDVKHVWLSLYDGYIFGAGYYESPDERVLESVESMIRMYDVDGTGSFATISTDYDTSFVLDAGTLEVVEHTDPGISGSAIKDAIGANWPLESLSDILDRHGSLWVSYPALDPRPGSEFIRAHLQLHDGYVFGSGYGLTSESRIQSVVDEAVRLYDMDGDDAFSLITSMDITLQLVVMDPHDNSFLAFSGIPEAVGLSLGFNVFDQDQETLMQYLQDHAGLWSDSIFVDPLSTTDLRRSWWIVLHDGYVFATAQIYSPEERSVGVVDMAIDLYKTYGKEAFDRITWQSVSPKITYPFVVDAQTWELVAHAAIPERVGVCCAVPIAESNDLDAARLALEQNPGIWLEYTFYNPISGGYEYKRAWFSTYDGYTFGAGYYYGNFDHMKSVIEEMVHLYDTEGKNAAFEQINAMRATGLDYPFVLEFETLDIVAHGQSPDLVGANFRDKTAQWLFAVNSIEADLHSDGDTTFAYYSVLDPQTGTYPLKNTLFRLHDGYIFAAGQPQLIYTR